MGLMRVGEVHVQEARSLSCVFEHLASARGDLVGAPDLSGPGDLDVRVATAEAISSQERLARDEAGKKLRARKRLGEGLSFLRGLGLEEADAPAARGEEAREERRR